MYWDEAVEFCDTFGAGLVSVETEDEQEFLEQITTGLIRMCNVWLISSQVLLTVEPERFT